MASRIAYKVEGQVQGVNFRAFTVKQAQNLGLTGYVQNDASGTVSGEAQGESEKLKEFVGQLKKGPPAAEVSTVDQSDVNTKSGETGFGTH